MKVRKSQALLYIFDTLMKKGYITKDISRDDRRANSVRITDAGRAVLNERCAQIKEYVEEYLEEIGAEDAASFNDMLAKFLDVSMGK